MLHEADEATTSGQEGTTWNLQPAVAADYRICRRGRTTCRGSMRTLERLDRATAGATAGWGDDDIAQLLRADGTRRRASRTRPGVVEELIDREGFGADDVPDLLFVNYKVTDYVGAHLGRSARREMRDSLVAQDAALRDLVAASTPRWAPADGPSC